MATKIRIEFNDEGFQKLLNSKAVRDDLEKRAKAVAAAAGPGFSATEFKANYGKSPRVAFMIRSDTAEARKAEAEDGALVKAIYAGK